MLLQECDRRGSTLVAAQAEAGEAIVVTWVAHGNKRDRQAVEKAGFRLVKSTFLMCIEMQHCPPEPQWPEGIRVRSVVPGQDDRAICHLMADVFAGTHLEPTSLAEWRDGLIGGAYFDADLWFVALHKDEIVGACLCAVYPETQEAWVRQLGVAKKWQRRGVGRALMLHAFQTFYRRGHKAVRIGVEANAAAHRLYEQVGMRRVQQYDEYQKRIG
jgi:mycothiol synthase